VTAARLLVDRMAQQGVRVLVAHDLDRSGACIAWTLGNDTRRYGFEAAPDVLDLGLRLAEATEMGLLDESAPDAGPGEEVLREYGLSEDEIEFLVRRHRRIELNAMTSDQFIAWLESKLGEHGAGKVMPAAEVLAEHGRRLLARRLAADRVTILRREVEAEAARRTLPPDLGTLVEHERARDPALPWEEALARVLADVTPGAAA
jgi:hypothetical protein